MNRDVEVVGPARRRARASLAGRILVVDDDDNVHRAFDLILRRRERASAATGIEPRYSVEHAYDSDSALALAEAGVELGAPFRVAFVDVRMVGSDDGILVTQRLLKIDPSIEIVVCTAYSNRSAGQFRDIFGETDRVLVLRKPFTSIEVSQLAAALCVKNRFRAEAALKMAALEQAVAERSAKLEREAERRAELEAELALKRRMETVGRLAAGISHEINTPLQFVGTSFEFVRDSLREMLDFSLLVERALERGGVSDEELTRRLRTIDLGLAAKSAETAIGHIEQGLEQVVEIVTSTRSIAHPRRGEREAFPLEDVLDDAIRMSAHTYAGVARIHRDYESTPPIWAERAPLLQAFLNILVNASQALRSRAENDAGPGEVRLRTRSTGRTVVVTIEDDGPGMKSEVLERVFDPFYTTKPVGVGTGQGLAVARAIVQQHHGEIRVRSTLGEGTAFEVEIPVGAAPGEPPS